MPEVPEYPRADRMQDIQPFRVMELLSRARQLEAEGRDIVHMEIGEPDFPSPEPVIRAVKNAIAEGDVHYTPATGMLALREAIAGFYLQRYGVLVEPNRIVVTPGASGALLLVLGSLLNPGQTVLMARARKTGLSILCRGCLSSWLNSRGSSFGSPTGAMVGVPPMGWLG